MVTISIKTIPDKREEEQASEKVKHIVEDRNKVIAKRFGLPAEDIDVELHYSTGALKARLGLPHSALGIFSGYLDNTNTILLSHPEAVSPVFGDNLDKETIVMTDYALTKLYALKKYFPKPEQYKLYHKYLSEALALVSAGKNIKERVEFDIKTYIPGKKYRKEQETLIVFYIMLEKSGLDYIYEHLDAMFKDEDVKRTVFSIYHKSFNELVEQISREIKAMERELQQKFRQGRKS
ncbi:MAG: hypothetical protein H6500_00445 [Candidatus Woesearchaeota archaeon]|nr:hypothetical protein [Nanoarchaeota archaeon]USN44302.1 MAG: hypothetical protein H6500_00445 [Candidatus Woesearchaeota archaeon]